MLGGLKNRLFALKNLPPIPLALLPLVPFSLVFLFQAFDPWVIDEAVFPYSAAGILEHGYPQFYNGETRPADIGLWHPPLYSYLLALHISIFGMSPIAVRFFGFLCVALAAFFVAKTTETLLGREARKFPLVATGIFLLNPLTIGSALVPDIDGTLGLVMVAATIFFLASAHLRKLGWRDFFWIALLCFLSLWTKFMIAGFVFAYVFVVLVVLSAKKLQNSILLAGAMSTATGFFILTFWCLSEWAGFDPLLPLTYVEATVQSGRGGLSVDRFWRAFGTLFLGPGATITWIGPGLFLSVLAGFLYLLVGKERRNRHRFGLGVAILSIGTVVLYALISGNPYGFPKYAAIALPGMAISVAVGAAVALGEVASKNAVSTISPAQRNISFSQLGILFGLFAVSAGLLASREAAIGRNIIDLAIFWTATLVIGRLIFGKGRDSRSGEKSCSRSEGSHPISAWTKPLVFAILAVQMSSSFSNVVNPFSSRYYYGETGLADTISQIVLLAGHESELLAAKDVGLQSGLSFYEDAAFFFTPAAGAQSKLESFCAEFLVTREKWDYSSLVFPEHHEILGQNYEVVFERPGSDFKIWSRNTNLETRCTPY